MVKVIVRQFGVVIDVDYYTVDRYKALERIEGITVEKI